jgi:hypothetical protein
MDTNATPISYHRSEVRLACDDFEMMHFNLVGQSSEMLPMVVLNKSNSGLGVSCHNHPSIEVGQQLNLFDLIIYEIRWIHQLTDNVINIGLKIIKELT